MGEQYKWMNLSFILDTSEEIVLLEGSLTMQKEIDTMSNTLTKVRKQANTKVFQGWIIFKRRLLWREENRLMDHYQWKWRRRRRRIPEWRKDGSLGDFLHEWGKRTKRFREAKSWEVSWWYLLWTSFEESLKPSI